MYLNDSEVAADALFFAGTPEYLRIDATVIRRPGGNYSVGFGDARNISYQVYSRVDVDDLTDDYLAPLTGELRKAYLQLPTMDPRVGELARRIVGSEASPAVAARLIEQYLRTQYGYTLELPATEPLDPIDTISCSWRKKGHREYFASSMACVMLRRPHVFPRVW